MIRRKLNVDLNKAKVYFTLALLALAFTPLIFGQAELRGRVSGLIVDETGARLPGATLVLRG
ncbi:MAG: hypothetical protein IMZ61_15745 [Planctomycetes bacterium]|nr:hypothetical protein [Planctomycetota bacterium]